MILKTSGILHKTGNAPTLRGSLTCISGLLALTLLLVGTQADAQRAHFRYIGGRWSHASHSGWNRYWGGPSIGFYYAPTPVYTVPGYAASSYYGGSNFWTSNPSFGISLNIGGGGSYYGGGRNYQGGNNYHGGGNSHNSGGNYQGSRPSGSGSHSSGGNRSAGSGSHSSGGNRSAGSGSHSSGGNRSAGGGGHSSGGRDR